MCKYYMWRTNHHKPKFKTHISTARGGQTTTNQNLRHVLSTARGGQTTTNQNLRHV